MLVNIFGRVLFSWTKEILEPSSNRSSAEISECILFVQHQLNNKDEGGNFTAMAMRAGNRKGTVVYTTGILRKNPRLGGTYLEETFDRSEYQILNKYE